MLVSVGKPLMLFKVKSVSFLFHVRKLLPSTAVEAEMKWLESKLLHSPHSHALIYDREVIQPRQVKTADICLIGAQTGCVWNRSAEIVL